MTRHMTPASPATFVLPARRSAAPGPWLSPQLLLAMLAALPLSACISFSSKPPPSLLTLTSAVAPSGDATASSASSPTIFILVPSTPAALATTRVPVQMSETSIAYVKGAQWSEPPARLFTRLLADTVTVKTGRLVVNTSPSAADPGARLSGELRNFGIDEASGQAVVTYDATLLRGGSKMFEKRRFETREPVASVTAAEAGQALNRAANRLAADVALWVGR